MGALERRIRRLHGFWVRTGNRELLTATLSAPLSTLRGTVVDIGGGRLAPHDDALPRSVQRIRLDISSAHAPDVVADAASLPFKDGSVDGVVMAELLEHVQDPAAVIDEARRVLLPGGRLVGSVPFMFPIHGDPHDYFRYTADGLRGLMNEFTSVEIVPFGNHYGAAWTLVALRSRWWRIFNPLMRNLGRRPDRRCPQGYVFFAQRAPRKVAS